MRYFEILARGIEQSGMTFDEIEAATIKEGVRVSKSYLSQIKSGKQAPPSTEMSKVLEKVLEIPEGELSWQGILERSPKEILDKLDHMDERYNQLLGTMLEALRSIGMEAYIPAIEKAPASDQIALIKLLFAQIKPGEVVFDGREDKNDKR